MKSSIFAKAIGASAVAAGIAFSAFSPATVQASSFEKVSVTQVVRTPHNNGFLNTVLNRNINNLNNVITDVTSQISHIVVTPQVKTSSNPGNLW